MKKEYNSPELVAVDLEEVKGLMRCACSFDDDNPWA